MLDLALAKHFAFLLHPDLTDDIKADWWLVKGRPTYRYWSYLSGAEISELAKPNRKIAVGKQELTLPKAMDLTLAFRPDVIEKFTTYPDAEKALAGWFFAMGMKEHLFGEYYMMNRYITEVKLDLLLFHLLL